MFGDSRKDVDCQTVSLREINRDEINSSIPSALDTKATLRASRSSLAMIKRRTVQATQAQRFGKPGTVTTLTRFYLHDLGGECPGATIQV